MVVNLCLLGPPRLEIDGQLVTITLRKALAILVYLADTDQAHSRDALATLFWPEHNQQNARTNLRRTLHALLKVLRTANAEELLSINADSIALNSAASLQTDVDQFEQTVAAWRQTGDRQPLLTPAERIALEEAVALYQDDFLAGFAMSDAPAFDEWLFFRREALRQSYTHLLQLLIHNYETAGEYEEAVQTTRRLLYLDGLEESTHRRLMHLYLLTGQPAAAVRQYEECRRILREELEIEPTVETTDLYESIRARRLPTTTSTSTSPTISTKLSTRAPSSETNAEPVAAIQIEQANPTYQRPFHHNLPIQPTPFVGRQQDIQNLLRHLQEKTCRLLSLIGPGGIGKTRLALAVAQHVVDHEEERWAEYRTTATSTAHPQQTVRLAATEELAATETLAAACATQFVDGIFFVQLQPLRDPTAIITAIADALGIQFYGSEPPEQQLAYYLSDKALLLLLDNFEHLLEGSPLLGNLLAAAPNLKLLVTSRESLKLHEEWFYPIAGLRFPNFDTISSAELPAGQDRATYITKAAKHALTEPRYDALSFFIQCAKRVMVAFQAEDQATEIVRICRLVDGMPLALELAAAWLKVLSCQEIAAEIEAGIDLLISRHQNMPERHRNMRVVLEQSWQLLTPEEQQIMMRLSIFRGGFHNRAASAIADAALFDLAGLLDKSFLRREGTRYTIHELTRQYAAEQLMVSDQEAAIAIRHSQYYLQFIAEWDLTMRDVDPALVLAELRLELDNLESSWQYALTQKALPLLEQALAPLAYLYETLGFLNRGSTLFGHTATQLDGTVDDLPHARLVSHLYAYELFFCAVLSLLPQRSATVARARTVAEATGSALCRALIEFAVSTDELYRQQSESAVAGLATILPTLEAEGSWYQLVRCLHHLGEGYGRFHQYKSAHACLQQALQIAQQQQSKREQALTYSHMGVVYFYQNDLIQASSHSQQAVELFAAIGDLWRAGMTANNVGFILHRLDQQDDALIWTLRAQTWLQRTTQSFNLGTTYDTLGCIYFALGDYKEAREAQTFALAHAEEHQRMVEAVDALLNLTLIALAEQCITTAETHLQAAEAYVATDELLPTASKAKILGIQGKYYAALGQTEQALTTYKRALDTLNKSEESYWHQQILTWQEELSNTS